jgi:hypothetical protein
MDDIWQFPNSVLEKLASAQSAVGHPIADDPSLHSAYLPVLPILPHDWPERTILTWESRTSAYSFIWAINGVIFS